jgi:hypothetical protein
VADESIWSLELVPDGWFAKELQADGWFDKDLLDVAGGNQGAGVIDLGGDATGTVAVTGEAASSFAITGNAAGTNDSPRALRIEGDDGGEVIKRSFYDRQIKEFEATLAAIEQAPRKKRKQAAEKAVEAFEPIAASAVGPEVVASARAITVALRAIADNRRARAAAIAEIEADLLRIAAVRRKRRNNEAALLLLM